MAWLPSGLKACMDCGRPCAVGKSRCKRHEKKRTWYEGDWPEISRQRRAQFPMCEICGVRPSTQVDHIIPRSLAGGIRAVCKPCHDLHGARADDPSPYEHDERGIQE